MTLRLYIWEGEGITTGYHQDGTLAVLASSVEEAREIALTHSIPESCIGGNCAGDEDRGVRLFGDHWCDREHERCREAINRPPERVVDIDKPAVVAFNGGSYG